MGQDWIIANLDKKEQIYVGKLGEYIYGTREVFFEIRGWRWRSGRELLTDRRLPYKIGGSRYSLGHFELPVEVIDMIFSNIDDIRTAFYLAVANTRLLIIGERHIHRLMGTPHWGGDRLMCVGDMSEVDDIPDGVDLGREYEDFLRNGDGECSKNIYFWADSFRERASGRWQTDETALCRGFDSLTPEWWIAYKLCEPVPLVENVAAVWNLSKQVYVLLRAVPKELPEAVKDDFEDEDVLASALLLQICWSTYKGANLGYEADGEDRGINRGKWAGDRFEVTGEDVLELRLKEEGSKWKDVSDEVIGLWKEVFEAERG